jgi:hypothetical protein
MTSDQWQPLTTENPQKKKKTQSARNGPVSLWEQNAGYYLGEGHNSDETEREPQGSVPVEVVRDEAQRDEHEHDVHPRSKEEELEGLDPARLIFGHGKELYETFAIREPAFRAVAVL